MVQVFSKSKFGEMRNACKCNTQAIITLFVTTLRVTQKYYQVISSSILHWPRTEKSSNMNNKINLWGGGNVLRHITTNKVFNTCSFTEQIFR